MNFQPLAGGTSVNRFVRFLGKSVGRFWVLSLLFANVGITGRAEASLLSVCEVTNSFGFPIGASTGTNSVSCPVSHTDGVTFSGSDLATAASTYGTVRTFDQVSLTAIHALPAIGPNTTFEFAQSAAEFSDILSFATPGNYLIAGVGSANGTPSDAGVLTIFLANQTENTNVNCSVSNGICTTPALAIGPGESFQLTGTLGSQAEITGQNGLVPGTYSATTDYSHTGLLSG